MNDSVAPTEAAILPPGHPAIASPRLGVLLVNLGSPSGADPGSVRRYLREFLSDPRVIEIPRPIWWVILNLFVLTTRPRKSAHAYSQVWNRDRNEAPLVTITRSQAEKLAATVGGEKIVVDWAMRYGEPAIRRPAAGPPGRRLRPHPGRAALSAIRRRDHGDRQRRRLCRPPPHAPAAGGPDVAGVS